MAIYMKYGYQLIDCQCTSFLILASDLNECDKTPCDLNAVCTNVFGSFKCKCNAGFIGDGLNCTGETAHRHSILPFYAK